MAADVAWCPACLADRGLTPRKLDRHWSYVLLEDLNDRLASLERWSWPHADARGRLVWTDAPVLRVIVPVDALAAQLYRPAGLERAPRISDAFAARDSGPERWRGRRAVSDLSMLFPDLVIDVSADARAAAKLAYQGALVTAVPVDAIHTPGFVAASAGGELLPAPAVRPRRTKGAR